MYLDNAEAPMIISNLILYDNFSQENSPKLTSYIENIKVKVLKNRILVGTGIEENSGNTYMNILMLGVSIILSNACILI